MKAKLISVGILVKSYSQKHIELFLQKREEEGELDGLLEFPGGKQNIDESAEQCLVREFMEETQIDISKLPIKHFQTIPYTYLDRKVILQFYLVNGGELSAEFTRIDFDNYHQFLHKIPSANQAIMENLKTYLESNNSEFLWI